MKFSFFIMVAFCILFSSGCGRKTENTRSVRAVKSFVLGSEASASGRIFPGRIKAGDKVMLSFLVEGQIVEVNASAGLAVKKGRLLARLDPVIYQKRYDSAKATYEDSVLGFERYQRLYEKKAASKADYERKKRDFDIAKADCEKAAEDLAYTRIYAPFDGIVTNIYIDTWQHVNAKQNIMLIQNLGTLLVDIDVPERDIPGSPGSIFKANRLMKNNAYAVFPTNPEIRFPLKIKEYSAEADPITQTITVTFYITGGPTAGLLPGVNVLVHVPERPDLCSCKYAVPSGALFQRGGKTFLWRITEKNRLKAVEVSIVSVRDSDVLVEGPLEKGMRIVAAGVDSLDENQDVRVLDRIGG